MIDTLYWNPKYIKCYFWGKNRSQEEVSGYYSQLQNVATRALIAKVGQVLNILKADYEHDRECSNITVMACSNLMLSGASFEQALTADSTKTVSQQNTGICQDDSKMKNINKQVGGMGFDRTHGNDTHPNLRWLVIQTLS